MKTIIAFIKKWLPYAVGFVLLVLISFIAGKCSTKANRTTINNNLIAARDSIHTSKVIINDLENTVFEQGALILSKDEAIKIGVIEQERLKKLHLKELVTNTDLTGIIQMLRDSLKLPPNTIFITIKDTSGVARDYVRIPFQLLKTSDRYIILNAGMNPNKTAWFDLSVPFSGTISVGYVKSGFLKTVPKGVFTTLNPYITINNMDVLIVKEPDKFYNKWWVHALIGAATIEGVRIFLIK